MTPYTVIGGYLGAGKSTLIQNLLENPGSKRLGLLINDFGAINIDASLIESADHNTVELTNGCICCSLSDGFHDALSTLLEAESQPDHILVEASGVADVNTLAQYGHHPDLSLSGVIVLVDSETIRRQSEDHYVGKTILRHLQAADLIVANKQDLISHLERDRLRDWLAEQSPQSIVWPATEAKVPLEMVLGLNSSSTMPLADQSTQETVEDSSPHPKFARWAWQHPAETSRDAIEAFLSSLPACVIRLKGLMQTQEGVLEVQVVGRRRGARRRSVNHQGQQLIAIGLAQNFDPIMLDQLAERYLARSDSGSSS